VVRRQPTRYEAGYVEPAKTLVRAVAPGLDDIVPGIVAEPRVLGSIFRINRDTRFSTDKRPYKDHLDLWFWQGDRKTAVSGLFLRVSPDGVVVGAGAHAFDKHQLARYRAAIVDARALGELDSVVAGLDDAGLAVGGASYTRAPRGFAADGPLAEGLLRHGALYTQADLPAPTAIQPGFVPVVLHQWRVCAAPSLARSSHRFGLTLYKPSALFSRSAISTREIAMELITLQQACATTDRIVAGIADNQMALPTPCDQWDVRALLNHLLGTLTLGQALLSDNSPIVAMAPGELPASDLVGDDPHKAYRLGVEGLLHAAAGDALDRVHATPFGDMPGRILGGFTTLDILVHGWDLATATGQQAALDDDLAETVLAFAQQTITADTRAPRIGPEISVPSDATATDRLVAFLGRRP
jgi:uncharacterized protein (TIGR03086 family)